MTSIFFPGDYRDYPNDAARPMVEQTTIQLEAALARLGVASRRIDGFLTRPHEAIEKIRPVEGPLIGLYSHWVYAPHTTEGVVGTDNPLLLVSNFAGRWPGLVGLLNTGASLTSLDRAHSRVWTDADDWTSDAPFMAALDQWVRTGRIDQDETEIRPTPEPSATAKAIAERVHDEIRRRPPLILMLGDTSMGMINGYFGPRLLGKVGFAEHKVDQAWIIERGGAITDRRIDDALAFVKDRGVTFHYGGDFTEAATREQLRDYLVVLDMVEEFRADCIGWQYQLGLIKSRPPSDFAEGLFNGTCRPESNGDTIVDATEADQGNVVPQEMMKRILKARGLHHATFFHDVRWGMAHEGRYVWILLNSGSSGPYAFNFDPDSLKGAHSWRQPAGYFPVPGGSFAGESLPGAITWARAYIREGQLWMDIGRGEVVTLPAPLRDAVWAGTTPEWPLMAADMGIGRDTLMAHYQSNHVAVAYGDIFDEMVALSQMLGFQVRVLGQP
jgi:L-fucose isomerase-like protein